MAKKSRQAVARHAKQSKKGKRNQPGKPYPQSGISLASQQQNATKTAPRQGIQPRPLDRARVETSGITSAYSYVGSDLKRIAIIAVAIFIILIVLVIFLG